MAESLSRLLNLPEAELYKADRRSRVWRTDDAPRGQRYVIKRFEYSPLRQRLAWWLGVHPAQRERRNAEKWAARGLPIVPIAAGGFDGGKAWLATELRGVSLERLIKSGAVPADSPRGRSLIEAVARLLALLVTKKVFFKDLKTSNILVDDRDALWLIDSGSMREASGLARSGQLDRMRAMLDRTAARDGVPSGARAYCCERFEQLVA